jgi:putative acetyltransferase
MVIRDEQPADIDAIRIVVANAFANQTTSNQIETAIIVRLRTSGALTLSLVAVESDEVVGHIAFSPVTIAGRNADWYGLGPVAVRHDRQRRGIGQALVRTGLRRLQTIGARGCVVVGEPDYYRRFGFNTHSQLIVTDVPSPYFLALPFAADIPAGQVRYHPAFAMKEPS